MRTEAKAGYPSNSLYGEPLCLTFGAYICGRYPVEAQRAPAANHKYCHAEVRKLMDYIHANLHRFQFGRAGESSSSQSLSLLSAVSQYLWNHILPRYVVAERIDQEKALLAASQLPILKIAESVGFANQSHITDLFRKAVGVPRGTTNESADSPGVRGSFPRACGCCTCTRKNKSVSVI
jgi:AraC family transcriptional regulator